MRTGTETVAFKLGQVYGPYAFGVISLIAIWFTVIKPTLETNRVVTLKDPATTEKLVEISYTQKNTAEILRSVSERLERIVIHIDRKPQ